MPKQHEQNASDPVHPDFSKKEWHSQQTDILNLLGIALGCRYFPTHTCADTLQSHSYIHCSQPRDNIRNLMGFSSSVFPSIYFSPGCCGADSSEVYVLLDPLFAGPTSQWLSLHWRTVYSSLQCPSESLCASTKGAVSLTLVTHSRSRVHIAAGAELEHGFASLLSHCHIRMAIIVHWLISRKECQIHTS